MSESRREYDTGAVRSGDCEQTRYDLISPIGLEALARTYAEGAEKFGPFNWENGMPATDLLNHAIAHIYKFLGGNRDEDHIGHAIWNLIGVSHSLKMWPELNQQWLRGPNGEIPPAAKINGGNHVATTAPCAAETKTAVDEFEALRRTIFGKKDA